MASTATVLVVLLSGCGPAAAGGQTAASSPVDPQLSIGVAAPINSLNPVTMVDSEEANLAHFVWAGLLGVNASGQMFPMLAQSVPSISNGLIARSGTAITFVLRPDLRWSDGRPITPADVVFGWRLARQTWADLCPATCWDIRSVTPGAGNKVTFHLYKPFSPMLFALPPVLPRHQMWKGSWGRTEGYTFAATTNFLGPHFAVDGPYRVRSATTTTVTFEPNPQWRILKRPSFDRVVVTYFPQDSSLLSAVSTGQVDIAQGFHEFDFVRGILPATLGNLKLRLAPVGGIEHLEPNLMDLPFNQVRVRQALNLVIDRDSLIAESLNVTPDEARGLVAFGPEIPDRFDGISVGGAWDPLKHEVIKRGFASGVAKHDANKLLDEAGWPRRGSWRYKRGCRGSAAKCQLNPTLLVPKGDTIRIREAMFLGNAWRKLLSVKTTIDQTEWGIGNLTAPFQQNGPCAHGWFQLCMLSVAPGYDPQTDFQLEFTSNHIARCQVPNRPALCRPNSENRVSSGQVNNFPSVTDINYAGVQDPMLNRIFSEDAKTYDLAKRTQLLRTWQVRVSKQADWISLFQHPMIIIQRRKILGLNPDPAGAEWNPWALGPAR